MPMLTRTARGRSSLRRNVKFERLGRPLSRGGTARLASNTTTADPDEADLITIGKFAAMINRDGEAPNSRNRDLVNMAAIKNTMIIRNRYTTPLIVNVAYIISRDSQSTNVPDANFFRDDDAVGTDRGTDFANTLAAVDLGYLPINVDRYDVLKRHTFILGPHGSVSQSGTPPADRFNDAIPNWKSLQDYIKVNRQVRFDHLGDPRNDIYCVMWAVRIDYTGSTPVTDIVDYQSRRDVYFHNVL